MVNPIILTVDDEIQVVNAIERDLRQHYRHDYRIIKATSSAVALSEQMTRSASPISAGSP